VRYQMTSHDLERAERHIAESRQRVQKQIARIARLKSDGYPTKDAVMLLTEYQEVLRLAEEHRDFIKKKMRARSLLATLKKFFSPLVGIAPLLAFDLDPVLARVRVVRGGRSLRDNAFELHARACLQKDFGFVEMLGIADVVIILEVPRSRILEGCRTSNSDHLSGRRTT
jgi:hypothetical protein